MRHSSQSLLDRTCQVLSLPEDHRRHLRAISEAIGLSDDDPAQIHVAISGSISHALDLHRSVLRNQPKDIQRAASVVAERVSIAAAERLSVATSNAAQQLSGAVGEKLRVLERRRSRAVWGAVVVVVTLLCFMMLWVGWSMGQLRSVEGDLAWSNLSADRRLAWADLIQKYPRLSDTIDHCRTSPELQQARDGGVGCQIWMWIASPKVLAEMPVAQQFLKSPPIVLGGLTYLFFALIGALVGTGLTAIIVSLRGHK